MKNTKRIEWVDYLKAFACFLVVLGHLLQSFQKSNIDTFYNITNFINWFIYLFHMPLFMCMSGYLHYKTKKDFSWKNYKEFVIKKSINFLIPYLTFYLLYLGINRIFSSSVNTPIGINELVGIINNPMPPYWFLYALLSIFIIIPLIEKGLKNNKKRIFGILLLLKIISIFFTTEIYFVDSFMENVIYFYLGTFVKDRTNKEKNKKIKNNAINIISVLTYICVSLIIYNSCINDTISMLMNIVLAIIGVFICVNIFSNINSSKILDTFKKYTFQIYLTHTIFAAGMRIILLKLNITNYFIHLILGLVASIYIPVALSVISEKIKYTQIFFYPVKTMKELKERKDENVRKKTKWNRNSYI